MDINMKYSMASASNFEWNASFHNQNNKLVKAEAAAAAPPLQDDPI